MFTGQMDIRGGSGRGGAGRGLGGQDPPTPIGAPPNLIKNGKKR